MYPVIVAPPSLEGALHDTTDDTLAIVPATPVGTPGVVRGVTELDATEALPAPAAFDAVTVNV